MEKRNSILTIIAIVTVVIIVDAIDSTPTGQTAYRVPFPLFAYGDLQSSSSQPTVKLAICNSISCNTNNIISLVDTNATTPSLMTGSDNLPIISYSGTDSQDLKVIHCGNKKCTLGNTITTVDYNAASYPSLAIGTDGLPIIAYLYEIFWFDHDLKVIHCGNKKCTLGNTITTVDANGDTGWMPSLAIGSDNLPIILHMDLANNDLRVVHCGNVYCSLGNNVTVVANAGGGGVLGRREYDLDVGSDGSPIIAYVDRQTSLPYKLQVIHCGDTACTSGNTINMVDNGGGFASVGVYPSITIGQDGLPIVSYHDIYNGDLKTVNCGNLDCSAGNSITIVDLSSSFGDSFGTDTSITIGADGLPIISYKGVVNWSTGQVKVAHCGNKKCTFGNTLTVVTGTGSSNDDTSITIG